MNGSVAQIGLEGKFSPGRQRGGNNTGVEGKADLNGDDRLHAQINIDPV